jgi:hypothetical protein
MADEVEEERLTSHDAERALLRKAFEQTSEGRKEFEALDLEAAENVTELLDVAAKLAAEDPLAFFVGPEMAHAIRQQEDIIEEKADPEGRGPSGAQQASGGAPGQGAIDGLDGLLDFMKCQKEYWGGRDDKGQESIRKGGF